MKLQDKETLNVADAVRDVLEGKVKKEEVKYPHMMYSPDGKDEVEVKDEGEHNKYAKMGYVHKKPDVQEVEEPRAKGEKDFKDKHSVKKSGMKPDGTNVKEAKKDDEEDEEVDEMSDKQKKYQAFFAKALKKFGVKSPDELKGDKKKDFFDYVDANYEADNETDVDEAVDVQEILGFAKKAAKKAVKGVQRAADKVTGGDSSGDKKAAIEKEIDELEAKQDRAQDNLDQAEKDFVAKKIDKKRMDHLDDYYNTMMYKQGVKIQDLEAKLKAMK